MLKVFVAFPYDPEPLERYRELYCEIEEPMISSVSSFADERITSDMILNKIRASITECQFSLCDVTGWNSNVCVEFELAIGMGKPVRILYRSLPRAGLFGRIVGRSSAVPELPIDMRGYDRIDYKHAASLKVGVQSGLRFFREKVYALIESEPGLKKFEIASRLGVEVADVGPPLDALLRAERIERRGKYQNAVFYAHGRVPADAPTRISEDAAPTTGIQSRRRAAGSRGDNINRTR